MIGTYYDNSKCMEIPNKEPVTLSSNFYRAIIDAEVLIGGKATIVNYRQKKAIVSDRESNVRILISEF